MAGATTNRNVKVVMNLEMGPDGAKAFTGLKDAVTAAGKVAGDVGRLLGSYGAKSVDAGLGLHDTTGFANVGRPGEIAAAPYRDALDAARRRREDADELANARRALRAETSGFDAAQAKSSGTAGMLGNLGLHGMAGTTRQALAFGQGLEQAGYARGGAMVSKAAPYLAIADAAEKAAEQAALSYHNQYQTTGAGIRAFGKSLPGVGRVIGGIDAFSGRAAGMQQTDVRAQMQEYDRQAQSRERAFYREWTQTQEGKESFMGGTREMAANPVLMGQTDRSTAQGERAFRERSRLVPVERDIAKLRRDQAVAAKEDDVAQMHLAQTERRRKEIADEQQRNIREVNQNREDGGSPVDRVRLLKDRADIEERARQNEEESIQARQKAAETRARRGQAEGQTQIGEARRFGVTAENLEDQASQAAGAASRLGGQNVFEQRFGTQAIQMVQKYGPRGVAPEVLAAAQQAAPLTVGKIVEKAGAESPEFQARQKIAPEDYLGKPEELRRKASEARDEEEKAKLAGEVKIADTGAAAGRDMAKPVMDAIKNMAESFKNQIGVMLRAKESQN